MATNDSQSFDSILQVATVTEPKAKKLSRTILDMFERMISSDKIPSYSMPKFTKALEDKKVQSSVESLLKSDAYSNQKSFEESFERLSQYIDRMSDYYKNNNAGHLAK